MEWKEQAKGLPIGSSRKTQCCGSGKSASMSNNSKGVSLYCHRCGRKEFHPHGQRSVAEVLKTRRILEALQSKPPHMPTDSVPITAGPPGAWQWVLKGGLRPEDAYFQHGFRWSEPLRRVLIPIKEKGKLVGVLARAVYGERPKYIMLSGPKDSLFDVGESPVVVVVEDVLSAIAVTKEGVRGVAVLGTSLTDTQAHRIASGASVAVGWFDGDLAGDKAWVRFRKKMAPYPVEVRRVRTDKDPKNLHLSALRGELRKALKEPEK